MPPAIRQLSRSLQAAISPLTVQKYHHQLPHCRPPVHILLDRSWQTLPRSSLCIATISLHYPPHLSYSPIYPETHTSASILLLRHFTRLPSQYVAYPPPPTTTTTSACPHASRLLLTCFTLTPEKKSSPSPTTPRLSSHLPYATPPPGLTYQVSSWHALPSTPHKNFSYSLLHPKHPTTIQSTPTLMPHVSRLTASVSRLTYHVSCLTSPFTPHVLRLTPCVSHLTPPHGPCSYTLLSFPHTISFPAPPTPLSYSSYTSHLSLTETYRRTHQLPSLTLEPRTFIAQEHPNPTFPLHPCFRHKNRHHLHHSLLLAV